MEENEATLLFAGPRTGVASWLAGPGSAGSAEYASALREVGAEGISEAPGEWRIVLPANVEIGSLWRVAARKRLHIRKLTHRRDTLEEIFLKAVGHIRRTPGATAAEVPVHGSL